MNWENKAFSGPAIQRALSDTRSDMCTHVEALRTTAYVVLMEDDSFGPVGREVVCKECFDKAEDIEANRSVTCCDCDGVYLKKDTIEWRWWDFYAPQGDEAMTLCMPCLKAPKHLKRCKRDREERKAEEKAYGLN